MASFFKKEQAFISDHLSQFRKTQSVLIVLSVFLYVAVAAVYISIQQGFLNLPGEYVGIIESLSYSILIFLSANLLLKFTTPVLNKSSRFLDITSRRMLIKSYHYAVWVIALLIILAQYTGNIQSLGISIGLLSAGLAVALQQPITSVVGYVVITGKRPFSIGDRIHVKDLKGDVVDITAFHTVLREFGRGLAGDDPTGVLITIPNSLILAEPVHNYTKDFSYIWDEVTISLTYESDFKLAREVLKQATMDVLGDTMEKAVSRMRFYLKHTLQEQALTTEPIIYTVLAGSSIDFTVRYISEVMGRRRVRSDVTYHILEALNRPENKGRLEIAYPHMQIVRGGENK